MEAKRSANFSESEISLLINLVEKYKDILECKRSNSVTWRQKEDTWQTLSKEFNSTLSLKEPRSFKVLKSKWENIKKNTKKIRI